jgi:hypothetical protein
MADDDNILEPDDPRIVPYAELVAIYQQAVASIALARKRYDDAVRTDPELANFFKEVYKNDWWRAAKAKALLDREGYYYEELKNSHSRTRLTPAARIELLFKNNPMCPNQCPIEPQDARVKPLLLPQPGS